MAPGCYYVGTVCSRGGGLDGGRDEGRIGGQEALPAVYELVALDEEALNNGEHCGMLPIKPNPTQYSILRLGAGVSYRRPPPLRPEPMLRDPPPQPPPPELCQLLKRCDPSARAELSRLKLLAGLLARLPPEPPHPLRVPE